jgi:hypothetical protein
MKKMLVVCIILLVGAILLESCSKKHCYEPMYNNPPALSVTEYNSCRAIVYNYRAYMGEGEERLRPMDHRDTIRVCGYITPCTNRYAHNCEYSLVDKLPASNAQSDCEVPMEWWTFPDSASVDDTRKCYVTGLITFEIERKKQDEMSPCDIIIPQIHPIEYHFE